MRKKYAGVLQIRGFLLGAASAAVRSVSRFGQTEVGARVSPRRDQRGPAADGQSRGHPIAWPDARRRPRDWPSAGPAASVVPEAQVIDMKTAGRYWQHIVFNMHVF